MSIVTRHQSGIHVPQRPSLAPVEFKGLSRGLRQLVNVDVVLTRTDPDTRVPVGHPLTDRQLVEALASRDPELALRVDHMLQAMDAVRQHLGPGDDGPHLRLGSGGDLL